MGERRAAWWLLGVGVGAFALVTAAGVLWWKLPVWQPEWVIRHSPFVEPVLRADAQNIFRDELVADRMAEWGASATPALLRYGRDPDHHYTALYWLAQVGDKRALPLARDCFDSSTYAVSRPALVLLARLDPTETARRLPAEVRRRLPAYPDPWFDTCDETLAYLGNPSLFPEALLLAVTNGSQRMVSLWVLLSLSDPKRIADALAQGSEPERLAILRNLSNATWQPPDTASGLPSALLFAARDQNADIRLAAIGCLSGLGPRAVPTLGRGLLDREALIRQQARMQIARLAEPSCLPYVIRAIAELPEEGLDLARLMTKIHDPDAQRFLLGLFHVPSDLIRGVAIGALADGRPPPTTDALARLLGDPDPGVRGATAHLAGLVRCAGVIARLADLVGDPDDEVATEAAIALGRIGAADGVAPLIAALTPARPGIHTAVLIGLAMIDDDRGCRALADYLTAGSTDRDALALALAALLRWTDPAQRQSVRDRYRDLIPVADLREAEERISEESLPANTLDADATQMRSSGSP